MRKNTNLFKHRIITTILILFFVVSPLNYVEAAPEEGTTPEQEAIENEVLIVYDDAGISETKSEKIQNEVNQSMEELDITVTETISESSEDLGTIVAAEIPEDMDVTDAAEMLMDNEKISYAQPNYIYHPLENVDQFTVNDKYVKDSEKTYYLDNAHVKEAWEIAKCEKSVTIAVLDTGCRLDHKDLKNNISDKAYDVYYEKPLTVDSTKYGGDAVSEANLGHGTHVCGLIGAEANNGIGIAGTSYNAEIIPIKIFDNEGKNATTKSMLNGLIYCQNLIDNNEVNNLRVINISAGAYFSGEVDQLLESQIETLADDYNVLCVCAGGNGDSVTREPLTDALYPSDFDECLSVTSLDEEGNNSSWSDYNMEKDISAPGEKIFSTYCEGTNYYKTMSGTSMSAPIVTGICALLWAKNPDLTVDQVKAAIESTADPVPSNGTDGREGCTGSFGAINAKAALEYVQDIGESSKLTVITDGDITIPNTTFTYSGERIKPEVSVEHNGIPLVVNQDYTVSYKNNLNAGTAKVTVQGIKNYTGTIEKTFIINKEKISKCTYSISAKEFLYTGYEIKPEVKLYYKGKIIASGTDYSIDYSNNIDVGKATVTVTGSGKNFTGSGKFYFNILKVNIADLSISLSETSYTYDGEAKRPSVTIKNGDIMLTNGIDYSLIYIDNVKAGTAKVKIIGIGDHYTGSVEETFFIYASNTDDVKNVETSGLDSGKKENQKDKYSGTRKKNEEDNQYENRKTGTLLEVEEEQNTANEKYDISDETNAYSDTVNDEKLELMTSEAESSGSADNNNSGEKDITVVKKSNNIKKLTVFLVTIIVVLFLLIFLFIKRFFCLKNKQKNKR